MPVPGDRRAALVRMTKRGHAEFKRQAARHEAWVDEMLAGVTPDEARTIGALLDRLDLDPSKD